MHMFRRLILALALTAGALPAFAQVPAPVPALPDTERRTSYAISASTCACAVNFALYGDSTDFQNWVEVFINGTRVNYNDAAYGWTITSPSGSLASIARPVTNAVLTFNAVQTGTIQIVGARRPRRTSQFQENTGVSARNLNQALTDIVSQNREIWDKTNDVTGRALLGLPSENIGLLPSAASRASKLLAFDSSGNPTATSPTVGLGNVLGPLTSVVGNLAVWDSLTGTLLRDSASTSSAIANLAGALKITGGSGFAQPLYTQVSLSGSAAAPTGATPNLFYIPSDTYAAGAAFVNGLSVSHTFGGSAATGGRQAFTSFLQLSAPTNASNPNRNYVAGEFTAYATASDGGTNTGAGALGAPFGLGAWCDLQSGATNFLNCTAAEFDVSIRTGASAKYKTGIQVVSHLLDAVAGASVDAGIAITKQTGGIGFLHGIDFSDFGGDQPVKSTGTLIGSSNPNSASLAATHGVDLSGYTFATSAFKSTGFSVDGSGVITSSTHIGGSATSSTLTLESTSGVGATDSILLKTGSQSTRMSILSGGNIGMSKETNPQSQLVVSNNVTTGLTPPSGTVLHLIGADGVTPVLAMSSYANPPSVVFTHANGTAALPTKTLNTNGIASFGGRGYDNSGAYSTINNAVIAFKANEDFNGTTNHGADIAFEATPAGSGTRAEVFRVLGAGNVKFTTAANFSANAAVATVLGSVGPAGSHTTVQKWLTIVDNSGTTLYIPAF